MNFSDAYSSKAGQNLCQFYKDSVCSSRLAVSHFLDLLVESNAPPDTENAGSSQDKEGSMNTSHEVSCPQSLYSIGAGSAYDKVLRQAQTGPTTQGPQDHI